MLLNTGTELKTSTQGLLTTVAYKFGNQPFNYALEGSVAIAEALVQWLRDDTLGSFINVTILML